MLINILLVVLGMLLLIKGGDWLVDGASALARRYKLSELAIGLTIVAFGTSAPEFVVSFVAALGGHPEISLGNVIGSNNFNLFLILGVTGLIAPIAVQRSSIRMEIPLSLLAAIVLFVLGNYGLGAKDTITRLEGFILLMFFALFLFLVFRSMKSTAPEVETTSGTKPVSLTKSIVFILLGLACLVGGGKFVVDGAVGLARAFDISEKVIGLTIVALGTSLPELVTSITAILKKSGDIAIGNIIGSNIFNIFFILGTSTTIHPMPFSPVFNHDIYILVFGTLLLLGAMFIGKKYRLDRWQATIFMISYIGYVVFLIMKDQ
ncbi:MAG: calcium/sodium antiporter [Bacteroidales bacterium]|jgi:cation:H+ antiporter|nr:calcium/sodium antiporter [Bacteroidales bacterium]